MSKPALCDGRLELRAEIFRRKPRLPNPLGRCIRYSPERGPLRAVRIAIGCGGPSRELAPISYRWLKGIDLITTIHAY